MKNNNIGLITLLIILLIGSLIGNIKFSDDLNSCKQSDSFYQEYSAYYVGQFEKCEKELNSCENDSEFLEKIIAYQNKDLLLTKDHCPICPIDEECIKVVKENKYICINREIIGGK